MDSKITVEVSCIHCGTVLNFNKKESLKKLSFTCPGCKHPLYILFDTTVTPQTYSFQAPPLKPAGKTTEDIAQDTQEEQQETPQGQSDKEVRQSSASEKSEKEEQEVREQANKHKTVYKKKIEKARVYDDRIPGEDEEPDTHVKRNPVSRKLKDPLYLTRKKLFGIVSERYPLQEGKTVIGRLDYDDPSDISIEGDTTISRRSICIDIRADKYGFDYILKVLNASNPVRVNGKELQIGETKYLDLGDIITLGHTNLKFDNQ